MAYGDFKDLTRRTAPDKILRHKAFNIARNQKYDGYQRGLVSMVYKCFDYKKWSSGIENDNISNNLTGELHKPVIRKFKEKKLKSFFIDNISRSDLDDMQLISKFNKGIRFFNMCYWYL